MRKLNSKNKLLILGLSIFTFLVLSAVCVFIIFKIKDYNVKYDVSSISYLYNKDKELITVKNNSYIKKDFIGNYYLVQDKKKVSLGNKVVIYNSSTGEMKLLGTFYEVLDNGETKKYTNENIFSALSNKIFKISDRKYLLTGKVIKSEDDLLNAENYLLVDLDKVGNSYVYNNVISYKSFGVLNLKLGNFTFKTNEEKLVYDDKEFDLAKISGSTNEYFNKKYEEKKPDNNGTDNVYPDNNYTFINNIHQTITNNKYVTHKTMVLDSKSDSNSITVSYMVYDPLTEFTSVYIVVKLGDLEVGRYTVDHSSTTYDIKGLLPGQEYTLEFYYDFKDNGNVVSQKFDEIKVKTKSVNGQITLDKVSANSVSYILKVDGSIDYAKANLYIDDVLVATDSNLNLELAKNGGYTGLFSYSGVGKVAKIVIEDATLNGANMGIIATYKYIL